MEPIRPTTTPVQDFGAGAKEAILDIVANPWTVGTFAIVTTVGSLLMGQDRFPRLKGATCWVMRDGMKGMYYVGLGVSGARAVYNLAGEDYRGAGHAMTLGGSIAVTKYAGDRWMQPILMRAGEMLTRAAARAPSPLSQWLRTQGRAMADAAEDRMAASGLALCAHSFDEIASLVVMIKSVSGMFEVSVEKTAAPAALVPQNNMSKWELGAALLLGLLSGAAFLKIPTLPMPSPAFGSGALTVPYRRPLIGRADDGA